MKGDNNIAPTLVGYILIYLICRTRYSRCTYTNTVMRLHVVSRVQWRPTEAFIVNITSLHQARVGHAPSRI